MVKEKEMLVPKEFKILESEDQTLFLNIGIKRVELDLLQFPVRKRIEIKDSMPF